MNENINLWDSVCETDPKFTKPDNYSGMTSINGLYLFKRATQAFGAMGIGWGCEILEERYDQGVPFNVKDVGLVTSQTHTIKLKLWFVMDGKKGEIVNFGHTKYIYKTKNGYMMDDEAPKKSMTDAMKKCLSLLGFGADIHMGQFEDREYLERLQAKSEIENANDKDAVRIKQAQEYQEWLAKELQVYSKIDSEKALKTIYTGHKRRAERYNDIDGQELLKQAFEKRLKEIKK